MKITISSSVLNFYPKTCIGYLIAEVKVESEHKYVNDLKLNLEKYIDKLEITNTNFTTHQDIIRWQQIYRKDFCVKPSNFRSSIESLLRRILRGKGIWNISSIVDLYNCCSLHNLLPMGAYDLKKINGEIQLRYGKENEVFLPLGSEEIIPVHERHIVYADAEKILCWLWNHKDSRLSSIDTNTQDAIFFVDAAFHPQTSSVQNAINSLSYHLEQIGCRPGISGILDAQVPTTEF